jgi:hypothetical protein
MRQSVLPSPDDASRSAGGGRTVPTKNSEQAGSQLQELEVAGRRESLALSCIWAASSAFCAPPVGYELGSGHSRWENLSRSYFWRRTPLVWRRRPLRSGSRGRPSRRAEPCRGSASFSRGRPCRLNDENSRAKVLNVRANSSAACPAPTVRPGPCPLLGKSLRPTSRTLRVLSVVDAEVCSHRTYEAHQMAPLEGKRAELSPGTFRTSPARTIPIVLEELSGARKRPMIRPMPTMDRPRAKMRILRAVDRAREFVPLRALLRFLRVSPSRFHTWRRRQRVCARGSVLLSPHLPSRLTPPRSGQSGTWSSRPTIDTSRPARSPSSPSGSARSGPRPPPGTVSSGSTAGLLSIAP